MWAKIGSFILRQRIPLAAVMLLLTGWMAFESRNVRMSYRFGGVLPEDDSTYVEYKKFTDQFSEDGTVLAIGYRDSSIWQLQHFNRWRKLARDLGALTVDKDGTPAGIVDSIFSSAKCYNLSLDTSDSKFRFSQIFEHDPTSQEELDSLKDVGAPRQRGRTHDGAYGSVHGRYGYQDVCFRNALHPNRHVGQGES
jgi:hypothetical protein